MTSLRAETRLSRAVAVVILALPLVTGILMTGGLVHPYHTFHWTDEQVYHYPAILQFERDLPCPDLRGYSSATTPLYHLLFAALARTFNLGIVALRYVNVAISYGCVLLLFFLLKRRLGVPVFEASLLTLVFELSPYFFGASFLLLTDNLALAFVVLSLLHLYPGTRAGSIMKGFLAAMLAVLTRQSHIWLYAVAVVATFRLKQRGAMMAATLTFGVATLIPLALLMVTWGGPFPPGFAKHEAGAWSQRGPLFMLANVGFYALFLFPMGREVLRQCGSRESWAVGATLVLIAILPVARLPGDDGYLWRIASAFPRLQGTDLIFWLLVPAAVWVSFASAREASPAMVTGAVMMIAVAAMSIRSGTLYQKYFDPLALVVVLLFRGRELPARRWRVIPAVLLGLAFAGYAVSPLRESLIAILGGGP